MVLSDSVIFFSLVGALMNDEGGCKTDDKEDDEVIFPTSLISPSSRAAWYSSSASRPL